MTSGVMLPLTTADLLAMTIVGSVLENMDMERLITGELPRCWHVHELTIRNWLRSRSANQAERPIDAECRGGCSVSPPTDKSSELISRELHERLMLRNEQTKQVRLPEVYIEDDNAKANVSTWMNSQFIHEAVPNLLPVSFSMRVLTDKPS